MSDGTQYISETRRMTWRAAFTIPHIQSIYVERDQNVDERQDHAAHWLARRRAGTLRVQDTELGDKALGIVAQPLCFLEGKVFRVQLFPQSGKQCFLNPRRWLKHGITLPWVDINSGKRLLFIGIKDLP